MLYIVWAACVLLLLFFTSPCTAQAQYGTTFDYIIVGGGTAGLVLANRLSENANVSVAVIEAGASVFSNPNVTNPDAFTQALGTDIDYNYVSLPQSYADNHTRNLHGGKALGGTSTINGMSYARAEDVQIDAWQALGNVGWNWSTLLPYYKKSERFAVPTSAQQAAGATYDASYHGFSGPLDVGWPYDQINDSSYPAAANASYRALGVPWNPDVNGGRMRGFSVFPKTLDREENVREDSARAYYWPFEEGRTNLRVFLETRAERIVWADPGKDDGAVAQGVEVVDVSDSGNGTGYTIYANREVVLSAGSLKSPVILEHSGVGNPSILESFGIPVNINLPTVGENLQDQTNNLLAASLSRSPSNGSSGDYVAYVRASDLFNATLVSSISSRIKSSLPSLAANLSSITPFSSSQLESIFRMQHSLIFEQQVPVAEILMGPYADASSLGFDYDGPALLAAYWALLPFARGSVHVSSADTSAPPNINPRYFMYPEWDLAAQVEGAKFIRTLFDTTPLKGLVADEIAPGVATVPRNGTEAEVESKWADWITSTYDANNHPLGTAAMMSRELGGVVSERLRVYATRNVRVVDASVLPLQLCGHLTSTIYAVAERAADLIKEDWGEL